MSGDACPEFTYSAYLKFQSVTSKPSKQEGKFLVCLVYGLGRPGGQISLVNPRRRCPAIIVADQNRPNSPLRRFSGGGKWQKPGCNHWLICLVHLTIHPFIHTTITTNKYSERERDVHIHIFGRKKHGYRIFHWHIWSRNSWARSSRVFASYQSQTNISQLIFWAVPFGSGRNIIIIESHAAGWCSPPSGGGSLTSSYCKVTGRIVHFQ